MRERWFRRACGISATVVPILLVVLVEEVVRAGIGQLSPSMLWDLPSNAGRDGGLSSVIVSTLGVLALSMWIAIPVGLATATWLSEYPGRRAATVRSALDVLASVPSIIHGLFGLTLFCDLLGLGWSLLAGALTVSVMVLPLFARLAEEALRAVPNTWRQSAAALGLERWQVLPIIFRTALPGLISAFVLSMGRVLAESAALMFTAGTALRMPLTPLDPGRTLALHVYTLAVDVPGGQPRAATAALVLFVIVALTTTLARFAPRWVAQRMIA